LNDVQIVEISFQRRDAENAETLRKNTMRIALIVDNPYRDLPGLVLLAARLCQSGARCYLVPFNLARLEVSALAPDFVLLTSLRKPGQSLASQLLEAGIRVGVLDSEGGVMPSLEMYSKLTTPDRSLYREVSCFCSWGPKLANYVKREGWYQESQVVVTGSPRFDFYAPRWRTAALRSSASIDEFQQPIILINGSFPRANPVNLTTQMELQSWMGLGFERDYVERHQRIERESLVAMANIANHLAARFPQATIVYRPHPFEKLDTYRELLQPLKNLHLLKEGTVEGWILRATAVIQHHCTTAIEAGMAGKPALLPDWLPTAQRIESTESVSIKCVSQREMDERLTAILDGTDKQTAGMQESLDHVLQDWFYAIDGLAHERVASSILAQFTNGHHDSINLSKCRRIHYGLNKVGKSLQWRVKARTRMGLRLPVSWSNRRLSNVKDFHQAWDRSARHFDVNRVADLVDALRPLDISLNAAPAQEKRDYRLHYTVGRSVMLASLSA
jgi:surface carbohydrate biosynthesis protein